MLITTLIMSMVMMSCFMVLSTHPLSMGLTLLIQVLLTSMLMMLMTSYSWFSYILFLIMVGGMLVLFIYMTSLASNEMFTLSKKMIILTTMMMVIIILMWTMEFTETSSATIGSTTDTNKMTELWLMKNDKFLSLNKMFNTPTSMMMITLASYLFLTLIATVKITSNKSGPLRQKI
uniref:NADH-ubiquinone oxidoreductase chain 6 n=1 Tax=Priacma serrata TaxID=50550 RepID=A0A0S2MQS3_PRISE|nr:NADH deshydrogenase subunit 6 [Priacma serrata]